MDLRHAALVAAAGWAAGVVNTIAGAGSLLTFPALLAAGLPPLAANVSNCIGVVPGSISGAYGLRAELRGEGARLRRWAGWGAAGSAVGAGVLLHLPSSAFDRVVPLLVGAAGVLVLVQPLVAGAARARALSRGPDAAGGPDAAVGSDEPAPAASRWTAPAVGAIGIYAGYFGAAIGVLLIGTIGLLAPQPLRRINAQKNVVAAAANGTAGVLYAIFAPVNWVAVLLVGVASAAGARSGRRWPSGCPPDRCAC